MPNPTSGERRNTPRKQRPVLRATHRVRRSSWHWFDHPEMQARIAQAEADLAEGRYTRYTAEEFLKSLEAEE